MKATLVLPPITSALKAKFFSLVNKTDGCWNWLGSQFTEGYGQLYIPFAGHAYRTHRISWKIHFGKDPGELMVCHHCDNPSCVNPQHLFLGTDLDNKRDMYRKGRANTPAGDRHKFQTMPHLKPKGEKNWMAKLTSQQVTEIRRLSATGLVNQASLAIKFQVKQQTISNIVRGKRWTHI